MNLTLLRKQIFNLAFIAVLVLFFLVPRMTASAAGEEPGNVFGFNYKVEYPENQIGKDKGYFEMLMNPGQEQTVNIVLSNSGKEKVTVDVSLNGTKTNPNGVVEYGQTEIENDPSLKFPFEAIVSAPETVELAGGEVKNLEINVKMPETSFDGVVLGGIRLRNANQGVEDEEEKGATVRNEYSYIVAMVLKNNETDKTPEIQINKANGSQRNYRNAIVINLSNIAPRLITSQMSIETQVTKKGSKEVLYERKQTGMSIAPNSQMDFYVSMGGDAMIPGEYASSVLVNIGDQKWEKTLDFTITKEEADKYNKRDVGLVQDRGIDWKIIAAIVGGILLVVITLFVIVKMIQKTKKSSSTRKRK